jgi:hypothetical protein
MKFYYEKTTRISIFSAYDKIGSKEIIFSPS